MWVLIQADLGSRYDRDVIRGCKNVADRRSAVHNGVKLQREESRWSCQSRDSSAPREECDAFGRHATRMAMGWRMLRQRRKRAGGEQMCRDEVKCDDRPARRSRWRGASGCGGNLTAAEEMLAQAGFKRDEWATRGLCSNGAPTTMLLKAKIVWAEGDGWSTSDLLLSAKAAIKTSAGANLDSAVDRGVEADVKARPPRTRMIGLDSASHPPPWTSPGSWELRSTCARMLAHPIPMREAALRQQRAESGALDTGQQRRRSGNALSTRACWALQGFRSVTFAARASCSNGITGCRIRRRRMNRVAARRKHDRH